MGPWSRSSQTWRPGQWTSHKMPKMTAGWPSTPWMSHWSWRPNIHSPSGCWVLSPLTARPCHPHWFKKGLRLNAAKYLNILNRLWSPGWTRTLLGRSWSGSRTALQPTKPRSSRAGYGSILTISGPGSPGHLTAQSWTPLTIVSGALSRGGPATPHTQTSTSCRPLLGCGGPPCHWTTSGPCVKSRWSGCSSNLCSGVSIRSSRYTSPSNKSQISAALKLFVLNRDDTPVTVRAWIAQYEARHRTSNLDLLCNKDKQTYFLSLMDTSLRASPSGQVQFQSDHFHIPIRKMSIFDITYGTEYKFRWMVQKIRHVSGMSGLTQACWWHFGTSPNLWRILYESQGKTPKMWKTWNHIVVKEHGVLKWIDICRVDDHRLRNNASYCKTVSNQTSQHLKTTDWPCLGHLESQTR